MKMLSLRPIGRIARGMLPAVLAVAWTVAPAQDNCLDQFFQADKSFTNGDYKSAATEYRNFQKCVDGLPESGQEKYEIDLFLAEEYLARAVKAEALLEEANDFYKQNKYLQAKELYLEILRLNNNDRFCAKRYEDCARFFPPPKIVNPKAKSKDCATLRIVEIFNEENKTVVKMEAIGPMNWESFINPENAYQIRDPNNNSYALLKLVGIQPKKSYELKTAADKLAFEMHFEKLNIELFNSIDFYEGIEFMPDRTLCNLYSVALKP